MMADLYIPPKPAIIRATELPRSPAEARGIALREAFGPAPVFMAAGAMGRGAPPELTSINHHRDNTALTTYNHGNFNLGDGDCLCAVIAYSDGPAATTRTISSVSIGGTNGSLHVAATGFRHTCGVASRIIAGGGIVNVSVVYTGEMVRAYVAVWAIRKYKSATPVSAPLAQVSGDNVAARSLTLSYPKNSVGIYAGALNSATTYDWTGALERVDVSAPSFSAADLTTRRALPGHVATMTGNAAGVLSGIAGAVWG